MHLQNPTANITLNGERYMPSIKNQEKAMSSLYISFEHYIRGSFQDKQARKEKKKIGIQIGESKTISIGRLHVPVHGKYKVSIKK